MKKIIALLLAITLLAGLAACTKKAEQTQPEEPEDAIVDTDKPEETPDTNDDKTDTGTGTDTGNETDKPGEDDDTTVGPAEQPSESETPSTTAESLSDIMAKLNQNLGDMPTMMDAELTDADYQYNLFIDYIEGSEALMSSPMIGSIAHCVVLLRLPDGSDAATVAADIKANADPRKWICVCADAVEVRYSGNLVMLVMSTQEVADAVVANFEAL